MTASSHRTPLVSVVIPVYDGEATIERAIRSVLAQTYTNFDLTVVNNCSKDRTAQIAESFAQQDSRVRVVHNTEFIGIVENHNKAFGAISGDADYVKILDADDWLFPNCLAEMVRVAEAHPTVGVVGSWVVAGSRVGFAWLPYPTEFMPGREICRLRLLKGVPVFGGPSALMFRATVVRARRPFYDPTNYHSDTEACLAVLQTYDFGYLQQPLSYMDKNENSQTMPFLERVGSRYPGYISELSTYGSSFLTADELDRCLKDAWHAYYQFLAVSVFEMRPKEFWNYHFGQVRTQGIQVSRARLTCYVTLRALDMLGNPKRTIEGISRRAWKKLRPGAANGSRPPYTP